MSETISFNQRILREELLKRQRRNSSYSLRALARDTGISRTTISEIIRGKRRLSKQNVFGLKKTLGLTDEEIEVLLHESRSEWFVTKNENQRKTLEDEEFKIISEWHFFAILNLAKLSDNQASAAWVAQRLGLSKKTCQTAIDLLVTRELIEIRSGKFVRLSTPLQTKRDVPSRYVRDLHRQSLELAEQSLEKVDVSLRDISSTVIAIDLQKLPEGKEMILKFRRKLADFLSDSKKLDGVYTLGVQLFPTRTYVKKKKSP